MISKIKDVGSNPTGYTFGRCPVCDAIVSLDSEQNILCDRCSYDKVVGDITKMVVMPTQANINDLNFNPFSGD